MGDGHGGRGGRGPRRIALSAEGLALLTASGAFLVAGVLAARPVISALGALGVTAVMVALVVARAALRALEQGALRIAAVADDGTPVRALRAWEGIPTTLRMHATLAASGRAFGGCHGLALEPHLSEGLHATLDETPTADAPAGVSRAFGLQLVSPRIGDTWLHGVRARTTTAWRLVDVRVWVPAPLCVTFLPRPFRSRAAAPFEASRAALDTASEATRRAQRGTGLELRELRDFQPGDPFKHIAWAPSARRGKLIAREFESEQRLSVWLLVDASASMFWGRPGEARIDRTLGLAAELARTLAGGRDRVGLIVYDHAVRLVIEPELGATQILRIVRGLLEVPHLVHEERTELTDRELAERVARWFETQERRSFALPPMRPGARGLRSTPFDLPAMAAACRAALDARSGPISGHSAGTRLVIPEGDYAREPRAALFRAFARHVGVALPRDPVARPGGQAHGLEAAVHAVLRARGAGQSSAHTLVALTDLHTADDPDSLRRVALAARRHRHQLIIATPTGLTSLTEVAPRDAVLMNALLDVGELRAEQNLRAVQAILRPAGAAFVAVRAGESLARILQRLRQAA